MKRAMIQSAKEVVFLCDHSKLNKTTFAKVYPLSAIDTADLLELNGPKS